MKNLAKVLAVLAGLAALVRILKSPKVCLCAGPICACGHRRR